MAPFFTMEDPEKCLFISSQLQSRYLASGLRSSRNVVTWSLQGDKKLLFLKMACHFFSHRTWLGFSALFGVI